MLEHHTCQLDPKVPTSEGTEILGPAPQFRDRNLGPKKLSVELTITSHEETLQFVELVTRPRRNQRRWLQVHEMQVGK